MINVISRVATAPARLISLYRCVYDLESLTDTPSIQDLTDFCFQHAIRPLQVPEELVSLFELVSAIGVQNALEIGTCAGGTLFMTCRVAQPDATIVSVDLPGGRFGGGYAWLRKPAYQRFARDRQDLHLLRKDSHEHQTLNLVQTLFKDKPLDFLFIDGDHTYNGVRADFEMYAPLVRSGGIIAFHDVVKHPQHLGCEVERFWNEIKHSYRNTEIIKNPLQGWAGIGILHP